MKKLIAVGLLLFTLTSYAQIRLEGVVKDSIGTPLELANIIAINQETNIMDSYAILTIKGSSG